MGVSARTRILAAALCGALAAAPASAQDGRPDDGTAPPPAPTVKRDDGVSDAAAVAGAIAIGAAVVMKVREARRKKKAAEAAAAQAPPPPPVAAEPIVETTAPAAPVVEAAPAPAPVVEAAPAPPPSPPATPAPQPTQLSHHGSSTSSNQELLRSGPRAAPTAPAATVTAAPPIAERLKPNAPVPPKNDPHVFRWLLGGGLLVALLALAALASQLLKPPSFRVRPRIAAPRVGAPVFTAAEARVA